MSGFPCGISFVTKYLRISFSDPLLSESILSYKGSGNESVTVCCCQVDICISNLHFINYLNMK